MPYNPGMLVTELKFHQKGKSKLFTPSDNKTEQNRTVNNAIRQIDDRSSYALLTGFYYVIDKLYKELFGIITIIFNEELNTSLNA
ncbi:hypothetical protein MADA3029_960008 [Vibrio nigripulchritudo MADA3029]|nr:hypothetical protein VIBNIMADA3020_950008 [Vibrio nigripulchritudo MADA3020]CCN51867.1 hypothetical protein VIBNIMADA3021_1180008 [Vibrio nigripulchritudo MADA3021]CCN62369.1 hypothetical protein MADA3029_960008 [Vibrio nigripulchritudo MADA3029]